MTRTPDNVLVAMSGGVDSSVAAALLQQAGYDVTGVFLCLGGSVDRDHDTSGCCSPADQADARRVAEALGIDLFVLDAGAEFAGIIDYFADEYAAGRTPNPCVHCNTRIKFSRLIARADALGARYVATGHHARRIGAAIHRAADKDQSYALFGIAREHLGRILLPIGDVTDKARVRRIAADLHLPVADKPDSQEICFVSGDYVELLRQRRPDALRPGKIVDASGNVLGTHEGVGHFTVGQRRGLRVAAGAPLYVTHIDAATATVTVGPKEQTLSACLSAGDANWHGDRPAVGARFDATVQIRYNHAGAPGRVRVTAPDAFTVDFDRPVSAVTPGQAAVVYDGDRLLGGGWIW
ncbi:MAG TPA: tRNA 2-thiouridine(34) synthase MnmA [Phycisphaerae bacterium]|nr:tRNA 2-thiouridine(34) synthase MnmA [Phycisphaerae bacterium]